MVFFYFPHLLFGIHLLGIFVHLLYHLFIQHAMDICITTRGPMPEMRARGSVLTAAAAYLVPRSPGFAWKVVLNDV